MLVEPHVVLIPEVDEQGLGALGLQLAQGAGQPGRGGGRRLLASKDDRRVGAAAAAGGVVVVVVVGHLVLYELVDVVQPEVGEAGAAGEEVGQQLLLLLIGMGRYNEWVSLKISNKFSLTLKDNKKQNNISIID